MEFGSVLVVTLNCCSWLWAVLSCSPTTDGILILCGPVETSSVTVLPGFTLVPNCGFVWVTRPAFTDAEDTLTTAGFSPALVTAFSAADWVKPTTEGTESVFPPPLRSR